MVEFYLLSYDSLLVRTQTLTAATAMEHAPKDDSNPGETDLEKLIPEDWKGLMKNQFVILYNLI